MKVVHVVLHEGVGGMEVLVGVLHRQMVERGVASSVMALDRGLTPSAERLRRITRLARAWKIVGQRPDIIFAHSAIPAFYIRAVALLRRRQNVVAVVHSPGHEFKGGFHSRAERILGGATAGVVFVSKAAKATYEDRYSPSYPTKWVPQPVEARGRKQAQPKQPPLDLLFVGRIVPNKDLPTAVRAFVRYKVHQPDASLTIAGPMENIAHAEWIQNYVESSTSISSDIRFLGPVSNVAELMAESDLLVHPSWHEAQSLTLIEAYLSGLPVAVTSEVAQTMWWSDPRIVFDRGDAAQLCDGMAALTGTVHQARSEVDGNVTDLLAPERVAAEYLAVVRHGPVS